MSYETFRASFCTHLPLIDPTVRDQILSTLDIVAADYDIARRSTDLIIYEGIPEALRMYIASKAVENAGAATLSNYFRILSTFLRTVAKPVKEITANDVRVYLHQYKLSHHVKDSTLEGIRIILNSFFVWCLDEDIVTKNPIHRIKPIKSPDNPRQPMTSMELEIMRSACQTVREKALVDVLYSTAARVSEVAALLQSDIDLQEGTVRIRHGKGDKARTTYLNPESIVSLQAYLDTREDDCPYLFASIRRPVHGLTSKALQNEIKAIKDRTKIAKKITPHVFRHTSATSALRAGMPIEQVQKLLGHSKLDTTLIYAHVDDSDVKANHSKYLS